MYCEKRLSSGQLRLRAIALAVAGGKGAVPEGNCACGRGQLRLRSRAIALAVAGGKRAEFKL
jgi:hypothetical protein